MTYRPKNNAPGGVGWRIDLTEFGKAIRSELPKRGAPPYTDEEIDLSVLAVLAGIGNGWAAPVLFDDADVEMGRIGESLARLSARGDISYTKTNGKQVACIKWDASADVFEGA